MAHGKSAAPARKSRSAPMVASQSIKGNVALPLSIIRAEDPVTMRARGLDQPGWFGGLGHRVQRGDQGIDPHRQAAWG